MSGTPPIWTPPLQQDSENSDVYFNITNESSETTKFNVYTLNYSTTFQLISGTYTIPGVPAGVGPRDTDVPVELLTRRGTLIGVIPLINLSSNNTRTPITFAFPTNSYAISVVSFSRDYYVIPQPSGLPNNTAGLYKISGATNVRLPYRNALVINGIYDVSGGYSFDQQNVTFRMEINQASYEPSMLGDDTVRFAKKTIVVPLTLTKAPTSIAIKPFTGDGRYTIPGSDASGVITREYLDGFIDLSFSQFATTDRRRLVDGSLDYGDVIYYLGLTGPRTFDFSNNNIVINNNKIVFKKVTVLPNGNHIPIPIKFLQEETPMYQRSEQRIGDTVTPTIHLQINKSTPTFVGQIPTTNTADPLQVYRLPDLNKMTTEVSFIITPPLSNNTDSSSDFLFSSSNESLLQIRVSGGIGTAGGAVYTAYIYGSGTATITVTQPATTNFNQKIAYFDVNIFEITPAIINCNTNLFYTNPYNREFWTRFKPECRSSDLVDSSGTKLTPTQVDEVYDMRRKAEILKYNKNVGGLTKSQKYAKAARGELMRKIGNEANYLSGVGGSAFTLTCPTTPANRPVLCGLTTACGVPGKERLLCYDPSVNLYNYKKTYEYKAGLQVTLNIPTTILTEPLNFRIKSENEIVLDKITLVWDAPESNGGFPITGYVITYSKDNKTWAPYKSVFPYNPATAAKAAGLIAAASATANGANEAAAASAAKLAEDAVIKAATYNPVSGEINGNSVVFERIPGSVEILANTVYYLSVFSGNVRGLSSVPATLTVKTSSVPSIITSFGFTNSDERQNLMVDLKWTDPLNTGVAAGGGYYGPAIRQYNLYYRKIPDTTWTKQTLDISSIILNGDSGGQSKRYILRNLLNENKYELKIEPINSVGVGAESAIITARTLMKPTAPSGILLTAKYGLLPPVILDVSGNYINVVWSKPDTGGSPIKLYNITITPPPSQSGSTGSTSITVPYNVSITDTRTTFSADIGRIGANTIGVGDYSITISAFNGYLYSNESTVSVLSIKPNSAKPSIYAIEGTYTSSGLSYAEMTFYIQIEIAPNSKITTVRINGLNTSYSTEVNIYSQNFSGLSGITGEHKIRIPARSAGRDVIVVGTTYFVSVTLVFTGGLEQTSELFSYTPEIKYLTT
jgi:hypothetical protein